MRNNGDHAPEPDKLKTLSVIVVKLAEVTAKNVERTAFLSRMLLPLKDDIPAEILEEYLNATEVERDAARQLSALIAEIRKAHESDDASL